MFYINIRMTQLLNHITILSELRNSINCMNDLIQDETRNNPHGWVLTDYTVLRDEIRQLYEYKRSIFTKKISSHFIEFRCDIDEIKKIVLKEEIKDSLLSTYEKYPLEIYENMLEELLELDPKLKEKLINNDPELMKKLNKK
jgi:hypothetical protein